MPGVRCTLTNIINIIKTQGLYKFENSNNVLYYLL